MCMSAPKVQQAPIQRVKKKKKIASAKGTTALQTGLGINTTGSSSGVSYSA